MSKCLHCGEEIDYSRLGWKISWYGATPDDQETYQELIAPFEIGKLLSDIYCSVRCWFINHNGRKWDIRKVEKILRENKNKLTGKVIFNNIEKNYFKGDSKGYVYFIKIEGQNYVKIGVSVNPPKRKMSLQTKMPFELKIINQLETSNPYGLEHKLHDIYSEMRTNGEWFNLNESLIDEIINFKIKDIVNMIYKYNSKKVKKVASSDNI